MTNLKAKFLKFELPGKLEFQRSGRLLNISQIVVGPYIFSQTVVYDHFGHGKHAPIFSLLKQTLLAGEYPLTHFMQSVARLKKRSIMLYGSALWLPMFGQWLKENCRNVQRYCRTFISLLGRWRGSSREIRWRYGWLSLDPFGTPGTSFVLKLSSPNQVIYSVEPQPCYKTINDWIGTCETIST